MEGTPEGRRHETAVALIDMVTVMLRHLAAREGMSLTTLSTLRRLEQEGPVRLTLLATAEGIAQPSMTQLVQRLERQGLATRLSHPEDGRVCLVAITDTGRELLAERHRATETRIADLLGTLPAENLRALDEALHTALPIVRQVARAAAAWPRGRPVS
ncbi:MarR family transcriptional regulator [Streptomyces griseocarneus]|nr:MarR family transcriptional regulator [Streptomyces griseocarneus]